MGSFYCRPSDIRKIKIHCAVCHRESIAEIPIQLAPGFAAYPCPQCGEMYSIHMEKGKWSYKKMGHNVKEAYSTQAPERAQEPTSTLGGHKVGQAVRIVDGALAGAGLKNPHPEHIGKLGIISKITRVQGTLTPIITLEDGTEVGGWECWWEPTKEKFGTQGN